MRIRRTDNLDAGSPEVYRGKGVPDIGVRSGDEVEVSEATGTYLLTTFRGEWVDVSGDLEVEIPTSNGMTEEESLAELTSLDGIGEATARKLLALRILCLDDFWMNAEAVLKVIPQKTYDRLKRAHRR